MHKKKRKTPNYKYLVRHSDFDKNLKDIFLNGRVVEIKIEDKQFLYYASLLIDKENTSGLERKFYHTATTDEDSKGWHLTINVLFNEKEV